MRPERDGAVASRGRGAAQRMPPAVSGDTQGRSSVLGHVCCMEDGSRLQFRDAGETGKLAADGRSAAVLSERRRRRQSRGWMVFQIPTGWTVFEIPSTLGVLRAVRSPMYGPDQAHSKEEVVVKFGRQRPCGSIGAEEGEDCSPARSLGGGKIGGGGGRRFVFQKRHVLLASRAILLLSPKPRAPVAMDHGR